MKFLFVAIIALAAKANSVAASKPCRAACVDKPDVNHQMIPHHQNAVNMCKALLTSGEAGCDNLEDEDNAACITNVICQEIVNVQNAQIQTMRGVLEGLNLDQSDDCVIEVKKSKEIPQKSKEIPQKSIKSSKSSKADPVSAPTNDEPAPAPTEDAPAPTNDVVVTSPPSLRPVAAPTGDDD